MLKNKKLFEKRKARNRFDLKSKSTKLRLSVHKSNTHISAQVIDDGKNATLVSFSTLSKDFKDAKTGNIAAAEKVGSKIGELALKAGVKEVVFDRGAYRFHGRIKALAEGARKSGLKF